MKALLLVAAVLVLPTQAQAVTVVFGGVFGADVPVTAFSRPGDRFRVEFDIRRQFRNGGNQVLAEYTTRGITQERNAFFNLGSTDLLPQGFTFSPGEIFSPSGFSITFSSQRPFYEVVEGNIVRLTRNAQLFNGMVLTFPLSLGVARGSIVNPTAIRILAGPEPCPLFNFEATPCVASASTASFAGAGTVLGAAGSDLFQSGNPEPGSWALLIGGFGAVGASLRRRRRTLLGNAARGQLAA